MGIISFRRDDTVNLLGHVIGKLLLCTILSYTLIRPNLLSKYWMSKQIFRFSV